MGVIRSFLMENGEIQQVTGEISKNDSIASKCILMKPLSVGS